MFEIELIEENTQLQVFKYESNWIPKMGDVLKLPNFRYVQVEYRLKESPTKIKCIVNHTIPQLV